MKNAGWLVLLALLALGHARDHGLIEVWGGEYYDSRQEYSR